MQRSGLKIQNISLLLRGRGLALNRDFLITEDYEVQQLIKTLFQRSSPITLNHTAIPIPIHPRINPAFAKPESSFLIPITPQIIATIFGKYGINAIYEKPKEIIGNIIAREIIFPIMPKIKDITPNTLPIFISPLIFVLVF